MSYYTVGEMQLLHEFLSMFDVYTHSIASQKISLDAGHLNYENLEVYGETMTLEINFDNELIHEIEDPVDDSAAVLAYAKEWDEAGRPLPTEAHRFFAEKTTTY